MGREGDKKTGITGSTTEQHAGQVSYDLSHSLLSLLFSVASCQTGLRDRVSGEDGWKEKGAPKSKTFKRQIYVIGFRGNSGYIVARRRCSVVSSHFLSLADIRKAHHRIFTLILNLEPTKKLIAFSPSLLLHITCPLTRMLFHVLV